MKIWFDISNSPQVNMFSRMITELSLNHEVIVTCRDLANTISLLELHGIPHQTVGIHYGKSLSRKLLGYPIRVLQLIHYLENYNIDLAISQSSFHSAPVARLRGFPSIYLNDNEHAIGNIPSFACATKIMVPEFMTDQKLAAQFAKKRKIIKYPGIKEGIYLWPIATDIISKIKKRPPAKRPAVYIRPEPRTAQYYKGQSDILDPLISALAKSADVTVFPRDTTQLLHYTALQGNNIKINGSATRIEGIATKCDVFIGAGGTMTREMAVLGIQTISVYQGDLLDVDRYLISQDALTYCPDITADEVMAMYDKGRNRPVQTALLAKGKAAYEIILSQINKFR
ncbi:DUF354 domain-containing protein [Janthinobacterium sp.]|uniref:DUF354 domain-containing protein n=1 Tax=Janthinobacterium sp. TaxID=1871054 RepID=UPI00289B5D95|nr:DUF354 domain-containing protein [Janthinobacterium sp.]